MLHSSSAVPSSLLGLHQLGKVSIKLTKSQKQALTADSLLLAMRKGFGKEI